MKTLKIFLSLILLFSISDIADAQPRGHYGYNYNYGHGYGYSYGYSYGYHCPPTHPSYGYGYRRYDNTRNVLGAISVGLQGISTIANIVQTERMINAVENTRPVKVLERIPETVNTETININASEVIVRQPERTSTGDTIILNGKRYIRLD